MFVKRRAKGDGGLGYPFDRDENPVDYLPDTTKARAEQRQVEEAEVPSPEPVDADDG